LTKGLPLQSSFCPLLRSLMTSPSGSLGTGWAMTCSAIPYRAMQAPRVVGTKESLTSWKPNSQIMTTCYISNIRWPQRVEKADTVLSYGWNDGLLPRVGSRAWCIELWCGVMEVWGCCENDTTYAWHGLTERDSLWVSPSRLWS
jgi:hypothetical protein